MIHLRPYQIEAIEQLRNGFKHHRRQVLCLPTGAGKTVVFSEMCRLSAMRGTRVLVLTDRLELFDQTFKSLGRAGIECQRIEAKGMLDVNPNKFVTVGMVETVKRRLAKMPHYTPQLIIIDEAHKGNFTPLLEHWKDSRVIGATATPEGKHFYRYYTNIVANIDIPELVDGGYLAECRPFQMVQDLSDLETKAGEYTDESLSMHYDKQALFDGVIENWQKRANGKKTIVFNVNIKHTENITKAFRDAGISSECVTSKTPKDEREMILSAFRQGAFQVLNNCGILTTGYDEPSIECVVMNRATKSLPLWLQCCGRGSRVIEGVKSEFIVLDFGMNHDQHGLWDEARNWTLKPPRKKSQRAAPVKECPKCQSIVFASARTCRYCDYVFPFEDKELEKGQMVEVVQKTSANLIGRKVSDLSISEIAELQSTKRYKPTFCWRVIRSRGIDAVKVYASIMGYSNGWVYRQREDLNNCQFTDYTIK